VDQPSAPLVLAAAKEFPIPDDEKGASRRDRRTREHEDCQRVLRTSIAETERLVDEAERLIRRHRDEGGPEQAVPIALPPAKA